MLPKLSPNDFPWTEFPQYKLNPQNRFLQALGCNDEVDQRALETMQEGCVFLGWHVFLEIYVKLEFELL